MNLSARIKKTVIRCLSCVIILLHNGLLTVDAAGPLNPAGVQNLIEGILGRAESVFSGQIKFHRRCGFPGRGEVFQDYVADLSFSGNSWAERFEKSGGVSINHQGKYYEYIQTPQGDGSVDRGLRIAMPRQPDEERPCPPYYAGTFWYKNTRDFLRSHADKARHSGEVEANGVMTEVLEWDVSKKQKGAAFYEWRPQMGNGGMLRVYSAPGLGYALPRIEYVAPDGVISASFDSREWKEVTAGIFFPSKCSYRTFDHNSNETYYVEFEILKIDKINEPIPEKDFDLLVPAGTIISDVRYPNQAVAFRLGKRGGASLKDFERTLDSQDIKVQEAPIRTRNHAVLLGINIAVLMLVFVGILLLRRRSRRARDAVA